MDIDDRLNELEIQMKEVSARNPEETMGSSFVTSRPEVDGTNFYLTFDVIYWHPKMGGTEYAITNNPEIFEFAPGITTPYFLRHKGEVKENDFSWDLGFKVGLVYKTPHDSWDVYAHYTWFESNDSSSTFKYPPAMIYTLRSDFGSPANRAKSHVDIDYHNLDLELARSYFLSKFFNVRLHIDAKATWINLDQIIAYSFSDIIHSSFKPTDLERKVKEHSRFHGLGPRMGIDTKYFIGNGFNIFADLAGSILYGYFKTKHSETNPIIFVDEEHFGGNRHRIYDKFHRFIPFVQMLMGLEWNTFLNQERQHLGLKLGYEVQYYWRVNQMMKTESQAIGVDPNTFNQSFRHYFDKVSEDLMFYGITGEVRLDF